MTTKPSNARRRKIFLLAVMLLLLACFFLLGGVSRLTNQWAASAIAHGDRAAAVYWVEFTDRIAPNDGLHHFLAARLARKAGDLDLMSNHLMLARRLGFAEQRIELERKLSIAQYGRLADVEPEVSQALANGADDSAEISDAYANGLTRDSRFAAALEILNAWKSDRPEDATPRYRIARIEEYLNTLADAKASYRAAIARRENYYPAMYNLARLLLDDNQVAEASELFERCMAMPHPAAAQVGWAISLARLGESDRAEQLLQEVIKLPLDEIRQSYSSVDEPMERFVAAAELGKLLASQGEFNAALEHLDLALEQNPRDLAARYSRAIALRGLKRDVEAQAEMDAVDKSKAAMQQVNTLRNQINRHPEDIQSRIELGKLLIEFESERNGLFWLRSALVDGQDSSDVHRALADFYQSHAHGSIEYARLAREHRQREQELGATQKPPSTPE